MVQVICRNSNDEVRVLMTDGFGVLNVFQGLQIREKFTDIEEIMYENANICIFAFPYYKYKMQ